jgi:hypothetical protein
LLEKPACPVCAESEPVHKVSKIYVAGITIPKQRTAGDRETLTAVFGTEPLSPVEIQLTSRQFGPPHGRTTVVRLVHPDMVVGMFLLMAVIFMLNSFSVSPVSFWAIFVITLVFMGGYGLARKRVVARHQASLDAAQVEKNAVKGGVENWMKLYYCSADGCVFDPQRGDSAPLDSMQRYLQLPPAG